MVSTDFKRNLMKKYQRSVIEDTLFLIKFQIKEIKHFNAVQSQE